ncbi:hypothetical protein FA15DRAFT_717779 [Coprinopsis marcescibilis]|uniref:Uncharacterized protein n=1 Tax=Coprinopsis marcescibilis TaxID=230819 RepID=A0A5C3KLS0_COPMA|nr:hypothetical protein FA15DRAFT_717779 [Coprinopsis marcescibilis]
MSAVQPPVVSLAHWSSIDGNTFVHHSTRKTYLPPTAAEAGLPAIFVLSGSIVVPIRIAVDFLKMSWEDSRRSHDSGSLNIAAMDSPQLCGGVHSIYDSRGFGGGGHVIPRRRRGVWTTSENPRLLSDLIDGFLSFRSDGDLRRENIERLGF